MRIGNEFIHPDVLPAMQAFAAGRRVDFRIKRLPSDFTLGTNLAFDPRKVDYRIVENAMVSITCEGKTVEISRESAKALNLI